MQTKIPPQENDAEEINRSPWSPPVLASASLGAALGFVLIAAVFWI